MAYQSLTLLPDVNTTQIEDGQPLVRQTPPILELQWNFTGHTDAVYTIAANTNYIYSGGNDNTVRKIDSSGSQIWSFTGHTNTVYEVTIDNDDNVYSASLDNTVRKIETTGDLFLTDSEVWSFAGHTDGVETVSYNNNYIYSGGRDNTVRKINSTGTEVWSFTGHTDDITDVIGATNYVYSCSRDSTVRKINSTGTEVWSFTGHTTWVAGIAVDTNGYVYSSSWDYTIRKINPTGTEVWSLESSGTAGYSISLDSSEQYLYVGDRFTGNYTIKKITTDAGTEIWSQDVGANASTLDPNDDILIGESYQSDSYDVKKYTENLSTSPIFTSQIIKLTNLNDVSLTDLSGNNVITYDSEANNWVNNTLNLNLIDDVSISTTPNDGQVLTYDDYAGEWVAADVSLTLDNLSDVNASTPTDNQVLTYDDYAGEWVAATPSSGVTTLDGLDDVNASNPSGDQTIKYDIYANSWVLGEIVRTELSELSDVNAFTPSSGQALVYDGTAWVADSAGASSLNELNDVTLDTPTSPTSINDRLKADYDTSQGTIEDWRYTQHSASINDIVVVNDEAYTASSDNTVQRIDVNGNQAWSFTVHTDNVNGITGHATSDYVFSCSNDLSVRKITIADGTEVTTDSWPITLTNPPIAIAGGVFSNGHIYVAESNTIRKYDSGTGAEITTGWPVTHNTNTIQAMVYSDPDVLYSCDSDGTVVKINTTDGTLTWSTTLSLGNTSVGTNPVGTPTSITVDTGSSGVYVADDGRSFIYKLDITNGNQQWIYGNLDGGPIFVASKTNTGDPSDLFISSEEGIFNVQVGTSSTDLTKLTWAYTEPFLNASQVAGRLFYEENSSNLFCIEDNQHDVIRLRLDLPLFWTNDLGELPYQMNQLVVGSTLPESTRNTYTILGSNFLPIVTGTGAYQQTQHYYIEVDSIGAGSNVYLPPNAEEGMYIILTFRNSSNFDTEPLTIDGNGANVDGQATIDISSGKKAEFIKTGLGWESITF